MKPWTVLVVDDLQSCVNMHVARLKGLGLTIVTASTLGQLDTEYAKHRDDLVAIILDGCVPGNEVNTLGFIAQVKADRKAGKCNSYLIAVGSDSAIRQQMMKAGCTHESWKATAVEHALELLTAPKGT